MTTLAETSGLAAADVMHRRASTLSASATVGEVREYFAGSGSHRIALLVDGGRYAGMVTPAVLPADADDAAPASVYAVRGPTISPDASADEARDRTLAEPSRRMPVVDAEGALVGIVAIDENLTRFCGT